MAAEYFLVLAVCLSVPLVMSFSRDLTFYRSAKRLILSILLPFILFVIWDMAATARGHWSFNPEYVVGITLVNLPLEEVLFFVVIPFASIFTWESVKYFLRRRS
jgi:lycopene cyclase domain-containing protein